MISIKKTSPYMTLTVSKKLWTILISASIVGSGIALACAGGWDDEYGSSNFTPEVFVDSAYSPFFLSDQFYYKIGHDENQDDRFNAANVSDWSAYLQSAAPATELSFFLEQASSTAADSAVQYASGRIAQAPAGTQLFDSWKKTNNKRWLAFLQYLQLAKKAESFAVNNFKYSWDYDSKPKTNTSFDAAPLNKQLQEAFSRTSDAFLKERYGFQLIRSYFFNGTPKQVIDQFGQLPKNNPATTLYYRSLSYLAGAYYKQKDYSKANYYYSLVYAGCDALKTVAHYSFHPQEEKDWNATLALCASPAEKATLWQMLGVFYKDEQRSIAEIYKLDPKSERLDLLLSRFINKYEQKFDTNGQLYTPFDTSIVAAGKQLVLQIAGAADTKTPWIWHTAAAYLHTLDGNYTAANAWYSKAAKVLPAGNFAAAQLRLLKLINTVGQVKIIDAKWENNVLPELSWLKNFDAKTLPDFRYSDAYAWVCQKMANKYRRQNDWVKAECFSGNPALYADNKKVEAMKAFLSKPSKTAYEQFCVDLSSVKLEHLFEYQAIRLCYADSLDAAIAFMEKAGNGAGIELAGNPFNGKIQDCHDCDHTAPQKIKYSKLAFLQKMKEMKDKIAKGEEVFTNALLLANAHYNISYFGNARFFYEGRIIGEGFSSAFYINDVFRPTLINMGMATRYYTLALQNAGNDEQKAKCQYMLAKCQRNQWYNQHIYADKSKQYQDEGMVNLASLAGFKALQQYPNTQYYKDVLRECGYFRMYTGK
jgi:hypothetical protein